MAPKDITIQNHTATTMQAVGMIKAFEVSSGFSLVLQAKALATIKETGAYKEFDNDWERFCRNYIGFSRKKADRLIADGQELTFDFLESVSTLRLNDRNLRQIKLLPMESRPYVEGNMLLIPGLNEDDEPYPIEIKSDNVCLANELVSERIREIKQVVKQVEKGKISAELKAKALSDQNTEMAEVIRDLRAMTSKTDPDEMELKGVCSAVEQIILEAVQTVRGLPLETIAKYPVLAGGITGSVATLKGAVVKLEQQWHQVSVNAMSEEL